MRSDGPSLAPFFEIGASPRYRPRPEAHWARELVLRDKPVDGRPPESGHAHDGGHPQEERRHHLSAAGRWYGRVALHGLSPERCISVTLGCKRDWQRAGFRSKSCVVVHPDTGLVGKGQPLATALTRLAFFAGTRGVLVGLAGTLPLSTFESNDAHAPSAAARSAK